MSHKFARGGFRDARQMINDKLRQKDARDVILSKQRRKVTDARGIISGRRQGGFVDARAFADARAIINRRHTVQPVHTVRPVQLPPEDHIMILPKRTIKNNLYMGPPPMRRSEPRSVPNPRPPRVPPHDVNLRVTRAVSPDQVRSRPVPDVSPLQGFRLEVRNLHPSVTNDDLYELFNSIGRLRQSRLLRPGYGEVVYHKREDAVNAISQYNTRELDGQPMEVKLVTACSPIAAAIQKNHPSSKPRSKEVEVEYDTVTKALFNVSQHPAVRRPVNFYVNM